MKRMKALLTRPNNNENRKVYIHGYAKPSFKRHKNIVKNQKYNPITFIPVVLYNQFKFFFNFYYLLIAMSQFIPALKVGKISYLKYLPKYIL